MTRADATAWVEAVATDEDKWSTYRVEAPNDAAGALKANSKGGPEFYVTVAYQGSDASERQQALPGVSFDGEIHNFGLVVTALTLEAAREVSDDLAEGLIDGVPTRTDRFDSPPTVHVERGADGRDGDLWTTSLDVTLYDRAKAAWAEWDKPLPPGGG